MKTIVVAIVCSSVFLTSCAGTTVQGVSLSRKTVKQPGGEQISSTAVLLAIIATAALGAGIVMSSGGKNSNRASDTSAAPIAGTGSFTTTEGTTSTSSTTTGSSAPGGSSAPSGHHP